MSYENGKHRTQAPYLHSFTFGGGRVQHFRSKNRLLVVYNYIEKENVLLVFQSLDSPKMLHLGL